jgi:hypothetical protein
MVSPAPAPKQRIYVEVRECEGCNHIGIDDEHKTLGACHECDWSGPEPVEDKCPGCERENVMAAACPDCGSRYVLAASKEFEVPAPQPHPDPIAWMVGTAFWWTKEEAERDAAETGLPIVGLGPMTGATPADLQQVEPVALAIPDECPHIIVFDDADSANEHFFGAGARTAALRRYEQISQSWNAHLFVRIARNSRDDRYPSAAVAEPAEVERLRGEIRRLHEAGEFLDNVNQGIEDKLRAQLAEAQALLRTQDDLLSQAYQHDIGTTLKREIRAAALPTSAEAQVKS